MEEEVQTIKDHIKEVSEVVKKPDVLNLRKVERIPVKCPITGKIKRYRKKVTTVNLDDGLTRQADKPRACIHNILKAQARGFMEGQHNSPALQGDIPDVESYFDAVKLVTDVSQQFEALPSQLREKFDNSPAKLAAFMNNEDNAEKAMELGLIPTPEQVEPVQVIVQNPPETPPVENPPAE